MSNQTETERTENIERTPKKILVTGGAGFLGSHLCRELLRRGCKVTAMDNFLTGRKGNIEDLLANPAFSLAEADVTEPFDFPVDEIYHLACPASPIQYRVDPIYTARICFLGALHALELADRQHARVLLASSSEVYGEPEVHPQPESYRGNVSTTGPRACYDEGKRMAETLFFDALRTRKTDVRIVRIFNTYGPCMDPKDGRIVSNFIEQALQGKSLTVYGDGSQTRSFCYVEDTVNGLIRMMEHEPPCHGPVNIGNPEERTVLSAAEEILRQTGAASGLDFKPLPEDDPTRRKPDIRLAKELLGWEPRIPFSEGVRRTTVWFREQMSTQESGTR